MLDLQICFIQQELHYLLLKGWKVQRVTRKQCSTWLHRKSTHYQQENASQTAVNRGDFIIFSNKYRRLHLHSSFYICQIWYPFLAEQLDNVIGGIFICLFNCSFVKFFMTEQGYLGKPQRLTISHRNHDRLTGFHFGDTGFQFVSTGKPVSRT